MTWNEYKNEVDKQLAEKEISPDSEIFYIEGTNSSVQYEEELLNVYYNELQQGLQIYGGYKS